MKSMKTELRGICEETSLHEADEDRTKRDFREN
ncbi:hypothetical protein EV146_110202 [Mesobacillus foraminis]|uniref:Uncharacterized protein n=1 Tax=Mesobacillus foraminis TaxID=279826 RepID=A0A4R2B831_9BACI|nr:hypothetical protein EV146_110202 [Mesobacillus foraminis]